MNKQILVVDDEPNVRLNYRMTLELEGFTVLEADSGATALEHFGKNEFDLAILDMRMPEMDGLELLAEMRERGLSTPTIIITAYGEIPHAVQAMRLGAIDFLRKPLTPEQLRQIATEVLERHEEKESPAEGQEPEPPQSPEQLHARYLRAAKWHLNRQEFDAARAMLTKAMELNLLSPEAFNLAGVLFEMQEDYERAKKHYGQAIKLNGRYEPAQQNMRRIFELFNFGSSREPFALGGEQ